MTPSPRDRACFEAGIKFGSLYHQFAGTPVSAASADTLEMAMADAIENQPHCEAVTVEIDRAAVTAAADGEHGYTELTGTLFECDITVAVEGTRVVAELVDVDGYPEMRITSIT